MRRSHSAAFNMLFTCENSLFTFSGPKSARRSDREPCRCLARRESWLRSCSPCFRGFVWDAGPCCPGDRGFRFWLRCMGHTNLGGCLCSSSHLTLLEHGSRSCGLILLENGSKGCWLWSVAAGDVRNCGVVFAHPALSLFDSYQLRNLGTSLKSQEFLGKEIYMRNSLTMILSISRRNK